MSHWPSKVRGAKGLDVGDVDACVEGRLEVVQVLVLDELQPLLLKRIWLHLCGSWSLSSTSKSKHQLQHVLLLGVVVAEGVATLELQVVEEKALMLRRDAFHIHDDGLDVLDREGGLDIQGDRLALGCLHEDLHVVVGVGVARVAGVLFVAWVLVVAGVLVVVLAPVVLARVVLAPVVLARVVLAPVVLAPVRELVPELPDVLAVLSEGLVLGLALLPLALALLDEGDSVVVVGELVNNSNMNNNNINNNYSNMYRH